MSRCKGEKTSNLRDESEQKRAKQMSVNNRLRPTTARSTPSSPRTRPDAIISLISVTRAYPRTHEHENFCIRTVLSPPALFTLAINPACEFRLLFGLSFASRRASPCLRFLRAFGVLPWPPSLSPRSGIVSVSFPALVFAYIDTVAPVDRVDPPTRILDSVRDDGAPRVQLST